MADELLARQQEEATRRHGELARVSLAEEIDKASQTHELDDIDLEIVDVLLAGVAPMAHTVFFSLRDSSFRVGSNGNYSSKKQAFEDCTRRLRKVLGWFGQFSEDLALTQPATQAFIRDTYFRLLGALRDRMQLRAREGTLLTDESMTRLASESRALLKDLTAFSQLDRQVLTVQHQHAHLHATAVVGANSPKEAYDGWELGTDGQDLRFADGLTVNQIAEDVVDVKVTTADDETEEESDDEREELQAELEQERFG